MTNTEKSPCLGYAVPLAGAAHQQYLLRLYNGLEPLKRKMIARWHIRGGWGPTGRDELLLLSSNSLWYRAANKCLSRCHHTILKLGDRSEEVPFNPPGWQHRFAEYIRSHRIAALLIASGGFAVSLLPKLQEIDIPFAVIIGGPDAQISDRNRWYAQMLRRLWTRANLCIFNCNYLRDQAVIRGCPAEKCRVIYPGCVIPPEPVKQGGRPHVTFISTGRLLPYKGHNYLIDAFAQVRRRIAYVRLYIVGDGPRLERLKDKVAQFGLYDSVRFTGPLSWQCVQAHLADSNVYVQPSVRTAAGMEEGLSNAMMEGMAHGLAVVASRCGAATELVSDGQTGLIVHQRDTTALAEAMAVLANNVELRLRMGRAARKTMAERFDMNTHNRIWRATAEELLSS